MFGNLLKIRGRYMPERQRKCSLRPVGSQTSVQPSPTPKTNRLETKTEYLPPPVHEEVEITYTNDDLECEAWIRTWVTDHVDDHETIALGFDMEWRPTFIPKAAGGKPNKTSVLQLAVEKSCLVFHIHHAKYHSRSLRKILNDERILKVGCGVIEDVVKLKNDYWYDTKGVVDLPTFARSEGCTDDCGRGLKTMAEKLLGMEVNKPKSISLSDWESFPLESIQIQYAAMDAWLGYKIYQKINNRKIAKTRAPKLELSVSVPVSKKSDFGPVSKKSDFGPVSKKSELVSKKSDFGPVSMTSDFELISKKSDFVPEATPTMSGKGWRANCQFICPGCNKKCKTEQDLEWHMAERNHPKCETCGKYYAHLVPPRHSASCRILFHLRNKRRLQSVE